MYIRMFSQFSQFVTYLVALEKQFLFYNLTRLAFIKKFKAVFVQIWLVRTAVFNLQLTYSLVEYVFFLF